MLSSSCTSVVVEDGGEGAGRFVEEGEGDDEDAAEASEGVRANTNLALVESEAR